MPSTPSTIQLPCRSHRGCTYHKHWTLPSAQIELEEVSPDAGPIDANANANADPDADTADTKSKNSSRTTIDVATTGESKTKSCVRPNQVQPDHKWKKRLSLLSVADRGGVGAGGRGRVDARSRACTSPSPMERLPTELLLCISAYLNAVEQASFALTCRALGLALGPLVWGKASKTGVATWYRHAEMLDVLQRDMKSEEWWRCAHCVAFHAREKTIPQTPSTNLERVCDKFRRGPFRLLGRADEKCLRIGIAKDPLYIIDFNLIRAVMDRHFLGPEHGVCLNMLRCDGTRTFYISETANMLLKYDFAPRIVLDRLLLRSTFEFIFQRTMFIRNISVEELSISDFIQQCDFWVCGHEQVGSAVATFKQDDERHWKPKSFKCQYCPTHYNVQAPGKTRICVSVWQNLGIGRNLEFRKWKHLSRTGKRKLKYEWAGENIAEAFERILCSTRKEFKKQLKLSDGMGNWYDPELQMRAYKTLPEKIAERL
ncbi:hypothetical protein P154DRAFT_526719 [Amniculicola lignicola CBS 123094]|uniref:F-box domain-containing protein n=1 Tax=Amniculicola lignicola CBS 123094 TaxID=1392246 RepID=A0A6A5W1Q2_9PLEO|nr:hypothetical protein P154DRAFT_526719 [Amniculicola lignicola CBS 123094]